MNDGPLRTSRPAGRGDLSTRQGMAYRQPSAQHVAKEEAPRSTPDPVAQTKRVPEKKTPKKWLVPTIIASIVVALGIVGWFLWGSTKEQPTDIDSSKYQAVFFVNDQYYYGKLRVLNDNYFSLTDIYYLKAEGDSATKEGETASVTADQSNVQLIKLGNEIHGQEDEMIISKDQVMFYMNLKSDGKVAQAIDQHKKSN